MKRKDKDDYSLKIKDIFYEFSLKNENEFGSQSTVVYRISTDSAECLIGDPLETMVIERYMSYENTVIIRSPVGLQEDKIYKSRIITQIEIKNIVYLIVISSYKLEAFKQDIQKIIERLKGIKKEGEYI